MDNINPIYITKEVLAVMKLSQALHEIAQELPDLDVKELVESLFAIESCYG